ncbi:hypothetical protein LAV72_08475 [Lysinibacillus xylanilyticus]|uniref:hypothetical protein n=1 Tax=Lysinibacillus xylanilyticus TaxID=582475 RepID=UPI002B2494A3|nr:hypothetical protein [Lysinibacillus xylanilyticus]MEB2299657.1 hypothetical protein [Lysinibacillus xylanilyticus]
MDKKTMRKLIGELTKGAVDENRKYSIVGEFFDMEQYKKFINSPEAKKVIKEYVPRLNIDVELVVEIGVRIVRNDIPTVLFYV